MEIGSNYMAYILLIVVILLCIKYIIFFVFLLPISLLQNIKQKRKEIKCIIDNISDKKDDKKNVNLNGKDTLKNLKNTIYIYIDGYIRYISIKIGYIPSMRIRLFLYKNVLKSKIAEKAIIYYGAEIRAAENLVIGKGTIIGDRAILDARYGIKIGCNVNFSTGVWIWTAQHDYNSPNFGCGNKCGKVIINNRAWLGPRCIIMPGVTIGEGAVVAGGAVVTKDVEPFTLVGGVPAKKIGERNKELIYNFDGSHIPFY